MFKVGKENLQKIERALEAFRYTNRTVINARDEAELLNDICRVITEVEGYKLCWVGYAREDERKTVTPVARAGFEEGYLESLDISWADVARGRGPTGTAIRTGRPSIARDIQRDPRFAPWREEALKRGFQSSIALPLKGGSGCFGALNIYADRRNAFDKDEVELLEELAHIVAFGVLNLRRKKKLRKSRDDWRSIFNSSNDGIVIIDLDYNIVDVNPAMLEIAGYGKEEFLGRKCYEVMHDNEKPCQNVPCTIKEVLEKGGAKEMTHTHRRKDGSPWVSETSGAPLKDDQGNVRGVVEVNRDITERKEAEEKLKSLDHMKNNIIANVSHELLTPITIIIGLVDILEDEEDPESRKEVRQRITKALDRQERIIDNLITLSNVFAQRLELSLSPADISTTVERAVEGIKDKADKKEIKVSTEIGEDITPVYMDAANIEHVVENLLDNAVKFSPQAGEVRVTAKRRNGEVVVAVKDEGAGIDPERLEEVFEPLTQLDPSTRRRHGGTGTGLAVAKYIVELHGGKIWAESEGEGKGSTFCFTLPIEEER